MEFSIGKGSELEEISADSPELTQRRVSQVFRFIPLFLITLHKNMNIKYYGHKYLDGTE